MSEIESTDAASLTEDEIRRLAREEVREVAGLDANDPDGEAWSVRKLMSQFEVDRRTALQAMGLIALGYAAPRAVLSAISGTAEAAPDDNLTVPNTLDAGAITTERETITGDVVRAFGPAGYSTDYLISDFADIVATINEASADGAAAVALPQGSYQFSTQLDRTTGRAYTRVVGVGADTSSDPEQTRLEYTGSGVAMKTDSSRNLYLEDLRLVGPGSSSGTTAVEYANTFRARDVVIESFEDGVKSTARGSTNYTRLTRCTVRDCGQAMTLAGNAIVVRDCRIGPISGTGVAVKDANALLFESNTVEACSANGVFANTSYYGFSNPRAIRIVNNYFESNDGGDIRLGGTSSGPMQSPVISNNYISSDAAASNAIKLSETVNALVEYNVETGGATNSLRLDASAEETETKAEARLLNGVSDGGTRTLREDVGKNSGDPSNTGQWNGNGREGIEVVDTSNGAKYTYRGGTWV